MLFPTNCIGILDSKYIILKNIGNGAYSQAYKIFDPKTNKEYMAKILEKYNPLFKNEVAINEEINKNGNPLITKYITSSIGEVIINETKEYKPYIIFELCSKGELIKYINNTKALLNEKYIKIIFLKIAKAIYFLHKMGICHRDIKLNNILLDEEYNIKICDFGLSSFITKNKNGIYKKMQGIAGTPSYIAPEIIMNIPYDGVKADIFSLGVVLFNLRTGKFGFPIAKAFNFSSDPIKLLYKYIKEKNEKVYWKYIEGTFEIELSEDFKELYMKMVAFQPKERPTLEEIFKNKYFDDIRYLKEEELMYYENKIRDEFKNIDKLFFN